MPSPDDYEHLISRLEKEPHDLTGWKRLTSMAEDSNCLKKINRAYDALLKHYPNHASAQTAYINIYAKKDMPAEVEALFRRFLARSPCIELWVFYLHYMRKVTNPETHWEILKLSYEFTLNHIGHDKDSGVIWKEYFQFLRTREQQNDDYIRKAYHRAIQMPLNNVEDLWKDLHDFENGCSKANTKQTMNNLLSAHLHARKVLRQLIDYTDPLFGTDKDALSLPSVPKFDASDRALVGRWKAYLKWEESNPLNLDDKNKATFMLRIQWVYRMAVIRMRYYTEIWFMAYTWTNSVGKVDEALSILKAGIDANPTSFLLNFAYAEALEIKKDFPKVHDTFNSLLSLLRDKLNERNKPHQEFKDVPSTFGQPHSGPSASIDKTASSATSPSSEGLEDPRDKEKHRTEYGLVWIMYMRFGLRVEGIQSYRSIFGRARREPWSPWEVYEAAAMNEYHWSNDKGVACRIFEKGLETFGNEIEFVLRYLRFLISLNDNNNARALFERVVSNFPPDKARNLWDCWTQYEYRYGNLEAALKLEKRMAVVYPSDPPIKRFAQRHIYLGNDVIADRDLGFALVRQKAYHSASSHTISVGQRSPLDDYAGIRDDVHRLELNKQSSPPLRKELGVEDSDIRKGECSPSSRMGLSAQYPNKQGNRRDEWRSKDSTPSHNPVTPPARRGLPDRNWDNRSLKRRLSPSRDRLNQDSYYPNKRDSPSPKRPLPYSRRRFERPARSHPRAVEKVQRQHVILPTILPWFIDKLPASSSFQGPTIEAGALMNLLRTTIIPNIPGVDGGQTLLQGSSQVSK